MKSFGQKPWILPQPVLIIGTDSKANCEAAEKLGIKCINVSVRTDFREEVRQYLKKVF